MQTDKQKNRQTGNQTNRQKTSRYGQTDQKKKTIPSYYNLCTNNYLLNIFRIFLIVKK